MARRPSSSGASLLRTWRRVTRFPAGRRLFAAILGFLVPYSGTIKPLVLHLEPGRARVALRDRRRVRNHLRSIHAIALANLGELTTGLAVVTALPPTVRSILVNLEVVYRKKARGLLIAECEAAPPIPDGESIEYDVATTIRDRDREAVCEVRARWRLGPTTQT